MKEVVSLLPPEDSQKQWGMFGYRGAMCDRAIRSDNAAMLAECLERDFFDPDDEMLSFMTVRQFCKKTAPNCYAMLQERAPQS
jgi:hypothetical protein